MSDTEQYCGIGMYFVDVSSASLVQHLCGSANRLAVSISPGGFRAYRTQSSRGRLGFGRCSRRRGLDEEAGRQLLESWVKGELRGIAFHTDIEWTPNGVKLAISRTWYSHRMVLVVVTAPLRVADAADMVQVARSLAALGQCLYGHIEVGPVWYAVSLAEMDVGYLPPDVREQARFADEIEFTAMHEDSFGSKVPRASWGTVLSQEHIEALGGESQLDNLSTYSVERWRDVFYLQLSQSPCRFSVNDLLGLHRSIAPLLLSPGTDALYWAPENDEGRAA